MSYLKPYGRQRSRIGFTLVELLVVIAIIGILVGLLVPAVNGARAAARKTSCINNQQQLAKAVLGYTTTRNRLPAVNQELVFGRGVVRKVGWVYPVFPMMEQQEVRDAIDENNLPVAPKIGILACPSDPANDRAAAQLSYAANSGIGDATLGRTEVRDDGAFSRKPYSGSNVSFNTDLGFISQGDGTTTTIMLSENVRLFDDWSEGSEWNNGLVWDTSSYRLNLTSTFGNLLSATSNAGLRSPSSKHKGGFVMAFCGGNTRFVGESIDEQIYGRLMTSNGRGTSVRNATAWQSQPLAEDDIKGGG